MQKRYWWLFSNSFVSSFTGDSYESRNGEKGNFATPQCKCGLFMPYIFNKGSFQFHHESFTHAPGLWKTMKAREPWPLPPGERERGAIWWRTDGGPPEDP